MKKLVCTLFAMSAIYAPTVLSDAITKDMVTAAQQNWGNGIVAIGKAEDARKAAKQHIDTYYAFDSGKVLFKPTLAAEDQFRGTKKEALSYFIGQDMKEDSGFALAPYTNVRWENEDIIINDDSALAMGNYYFTTTNGDEVKVEYSFGYVLDDESKLKINLHHSSLPFDPS